MRLSGWKDKVESCVDADLAGVVVLGVKFKRGLLEPCQNCPAREGDAVVKERLPRTEGPGVVETRDMGRDAGRLGCAERTSCRTGRGVLVRCGAIGERDPCPVHPCKGSISRVKHPRAGGLDPKGFYFWKPPEAGPTELLFDIKLYEPRQTRPNRLS